jgi:hypothetical protein
MYAVKTMGIDPDAILPEIDRVKNGFISIVGCQAKGFSLVPIGVGNQGVAFDRRLR